MFLIFGLGRPDVLPVDDLGFRAAVRRHYGLAALLLLPGRPNQANGLIVHSHARRSQRVQLTTCRC